VPAEPSEKLKSLARPAWQSTFPISELQVCVKAGP
jgi:hypothetical protein